MLAFLVVIVLCTPTFAAANADSAGDTGAGETGGDPATDADGDRFSLGDGDCDDQNAEIYPGRDETCDQLDNDCDERVDEGCPPATETGGGCDWGAGLALPGIWLSSWVFRRRRPAAVGPLPAR